MCSWANSDTRDVESDAATWGSWRGGCHGFTVHFSTRVNRATHPPLLLELWCESTPSLLTSMPYLHSTHARLVRVSAWHSPGRTPFNKRLSVEGGRVRGRVGWSAWSLCFLLDWKALVCGKWGTVSTSLYCNSQCCMTTYCHIPLPRVKWTNQSLARMSGSFSIDTVILPLNGQ